MGILPPLRDGCPLDKGFLGHKPWGDQVSFYQPRGVPAPGLPAHTLTTFSRGVRILTHPNPKIYPLKRSQIFSGALQAPDPPTHPPPGGSAFWPKIGKAVPAHPTPGVELSLKRSLGDVQNSGNKNSNAKNYDANGTNFLII